MKHEYRITLPLGTYKFVSNGIDLDRVITNFMDRGFAPNQLSVEIVPLPPKEMKKP